MFNVITDAVALTLMLMHAIQCFQGVSAKGMIRKAMLLQVLACCLHTVNMYNVTLYKIM